MLTRCPTFNFKNETRVVDRKCRRMLLRPHHIDLIIEYCQIIQRSSLSEFLLSTISRKYVRFSFFTIPHFVSLIAERIRFENHMLHMICSIKFNIN